MCSVSHRICRGPISHQLEEGGHHSAVVVPRLLLCLRGHLCFGRSRCAQSLSWIHHASMKASKSVCPGLPPQEAPVMIAGKRKLLFLSPPPFHASMMQRDKDTMLPQLHVSLVRSFSCAAFYFLCSALSFPSSCLCPCSYPLFSSSSSPSCCPVWLGTAALAG